MTDLRLITDDDITAAQRAVTRTKFTGMHHDSYGELNIEDYELTLSCGHTHYYELHSHQTDEALAGPFFCGECFTNVNI